MENTELVSKPLNAEQASEMLGVAEATVRKWVLERAIPYHKIGRLIRFDEKELLNFWNQTKQEPICREGDK